MKFERFHEQLDKHTNTFGKLEPFTGDITEVILMENLYQREVMSNLLKNVNEGKKYTTCYMIAKSDLIELGLDTTSDFYTTTHKSPLSTPVLIPL